MELEQLKHSLKPKFVVKDKGWTPTLDQKKGTHALKIWVEKSIYEYHLHTLLESMHNKLVLAFEGQIVVNGEPIISSHRHAVTEQWQLARKKAVAMLKTGESYRPLVLPPGERGEVGLGLKIEIPKAPVPFKGVYKVRAYSHISPQLNIGVILHPESITCGYREEPHLTLVNYSKNYVIFSHGFSLVYGSYELEIDVDGYDGEEIVVEQPAD